MKDTHQIRVAGVGTAIGAVIFGAFMASCAPGKLPCDKDDQWKAVCDEPETAQGGSGGGGGGQGGAPGTGGGMPGSGGGGGEPGITTATTIDCAAFPTLGDMDKFFAMRCAPDGQVGCHPTGMLAWQDLKTEKIWERLADKPSSFACKPGKLIDKANWQNSVMLKKTKMPVECQPGGVTPGGVMPDQTMAMKMDLLKPEEITCLENFLKKIAGVN